MQLYVDDDIDTLFIYLKVSPQGGIRGGPVPFCASFNGEEVRREELILAGETKNGFINSPSNGGGAFVLDITYPTRLISEIISNHFIL